MTYDNILRFADDPDVRDPIKFLREREIVHFQRFGEANHTKLSKRDPLQATAHRGFFHSLSRRFRPPDSRQQCNPGTGNRSRN